MSNSHHPLGSDRVDRLREVIKSPQSALQAPMELLAAPLRFLAFWSAVTLPFLYLPLLLGGLHASERTVFVTLLVLNSAALVIGHGYAVEDR